MDLDAYRRLRAEARRHARRAQDADDLVQDVLLIALEQGRDDPAWLAGVIRNRAAMDARGALRRRRREATATQDETASAPESAPSPAHLLARLPPAARRVAVLALHGLDAAEIRWVLGIGEAAFRQRLTSIRKVIGALPPAQRAEAMALAYVRDPARSVDLQFGLIRRALKAALRGDAGIGTHDADGHLIVVRSRAHTSTGGGNEDR
jgi:DNA-directed RNA polymerase specialized sigma24 family protein